MNYNEVQSIVYTILLDFLPVDNKEELTNETMLITDGFLNSIDIVDLIIRLEDKFGIEFKIEELEISSFNTIEKITELIYNRIIKSAFEGEMNGNI